MFCYQCEQTAKGTGCDKFGVCGKSPEVADLQDLLDHATKGISMYAHRAGQLGARDHDVDAFILEALFSTVTNVDFDPDRIESFIRKAAEIKDKAKNLYEDACRTAGQTPEELSGPAQWVPGSTREELVADGKKVGINTARQALGDDIAGLQHLLLYGLKGTAAYADHAMILGEEDVCMRSSTRPLTAWLRRILLSMNSSDSACAVVK
jgi:hydroxylamine reductase